VFARCQASFPRGPRVRVRTIVLLLTGDRRQYFFVICTSLARLCSIISRRCHKIGSSALLCGWHGALLIVKMFCYAR